MSPEDRDDSAVHGRRFRRRPQHVVVAGAGVAALEACLAVRALAGDRAQLTLIAPEPAFAYRSPGAADPLDARHVRRIPMCDVAAATRADLHRDRLVAVDGAARRAVTETGIELSYDALVVATGAVPQPVADGAVSIRDHVEAGALRDELTATKRGTVGAVALVAAPAPAWRLELYELALDLALAARHGRGATSVTLVTPEEAPMAILGPRLAFTLRHTLTAHGIRVIASAYLHSVTARELVLAPGGARVAADRVLAAPRLEGPRLEGLAHDAQGFLPVDRLGRVEGADGVYAAGDCTDFPVKHASLAAQQADAAAAAIAHTGDPLAFKPVLRCMLPSRLRWYVEAPIAGGQGDVAQLSPTPLWPPVTRWEAHYLSAFLARAPATHDRELRAAAVENARRALRSFSAFGQRS